MNANSTSLPALALDVLEFWFGPDPAPDHVSEEKMDLWFWNGSAYDEQVRETFGRWLDPAAAGAFDRWCEAPRGRLALLILTDQMPRHVHRGTARAFAADAKAREVCLAGLRREHDLLLSPIERTVFYLPLEHAEDLVLQERCVALYRRMSTEVEGERAEDFANFVNYAAAHRDIIARFGHFPHRSEALGRPLTDEEHEFLTQPGSSF